MNFIPLVCTVVVAVRTLGWPLRGDVCLIHYAVFLMDRGWQPYLGIGGINFPGAYLIDWLVMHTLGPGALAERLFDFLLSGVALAAMVRLCPKPLRLAGVLSGLLLFLVHSRDGAVQLGQRDFSLIVLVLVCFALVFPEMRLGSLRLLSCAGVILGFAAIVKPLALLFAIPVAIGLLSGREESRQRFLPVSVFSLGVVIPCVLAALWLVRHGALGYFLLSTLPMIQYHAGLHRIPLMTLVSRGTSPLLFLLMAGVVFFPYRSERLRNREFLILVGGVAAGFAYFVLQGKGYPYQRYPLTAFLLLCASLVLVDAQRSAGWAKSLSTVVLGAVCLITAPLAARRAVSYRPEYDQFGADLTGDLESLGGGALDGKIQCLDTFSGCIRVLFAMRLVPSTGTIYDEFLFARSPTPVVAKNRAEFLAKIERNAPQVIVMTPQFYSGAVDSYQKIDTWPEFSTYFAENYALFVERAPGQPQLWEGAPMVPLGYRIYVRQEHAKCSGSCEAQVAKF